MFSRLLYCEFGSKMLKIALAHLTADTRVPVLSATPPPESLESDQSDSAICASVKVSDYNTVDGSSWICVRLTTVSSNHESLNQNKHLGSIMPCWKPLIVSSQFTLSRAGLSTKLRTNTLFFKKTNRSSQTHTPFDLSVWFGQEHNITLKSSESASERENLKCLLMKFNTTVK